MNGHSEKTTYFADQTPRRLTSCRGAQSTPTRVPDDGQTEGDKGGIHWDIFSFGANRKLVLAFKGRVKVHEGVIVAEGRAHLLEKLRQASHARFPLLAAHLLEVYRHKCRPLRLHLLPRPTGEKKKEKGSEVS
jgi:hypothetical protein